MNPELMEFTFENTGYNYVSYQGRLPKVLL